MTKKPKVYHRYALLSKRGTLVETWDTDSGRNWLFTRRASAREWQDTLTADGDPVRVVKVKIQVVQP